MPSNRDIIELNSRMLALYVEVSTFAGEIDVQNVLVEVAYLRDTLGPSPTPALLGTFTRYLDLISLHLDADAQASLAALLTRPDRPDAASLPTPFAGQSDQLSPMASDAQPGISLVTCSMNRTEN